MARGAYITSPESKELVIVDAEKRSVVSRLVVGAGPLGIAVAPDGQRVFVADWYVHKLFAVDPVAVKIVGEVDVGQSPSGVAVTPDGQLIVTADRDSNRGLAD